MHAPAFDSRGCRCANARRSGEIGLSAIRYAGYWARNARDLTPDELSKLDDSFTDTFPAVRDGLNVVSSHGLFRLRFHRVAVLSFEDLRDGFVG